MNVYVWIQQPQEEMKTAIARVTAVHDDGVDLVLDNGATLIGWHGAMYDVDGNEIPLETIRRDFLSTDTASLLARIAQLEQIVTQP